MMKLPMTAFVYSMEMFVKTIQGLQKIADQGIDAMLNGAAQSPGDTQSDPTIGTPPTGMTQAADYSPSNRGHLTGGRKTFVTSGIVAGDDETNLKEERKMPDTNLNDDMLKLVRYKILFVKRDYEHAFPEQEELVSDNLTATSYTAWKIAQFIQSLGKKETEIPSKWKEDGYPPDDVKYRYGNKLMGLPEDDKKYLRVYFEVLDRYVREQFRYEEDQIDVLKEIRDAIRKKDYGGSGGGSASHGGGGTAGGGKGTGM